MVRMKKDCVGCETCIGCINGKAYPVLVCDKCGSEVENLYKTERGDLCEDCTLEGIESYTVEGLDDEYYSRAS